MLEDELRISSYKNAIMNNKAHFEGKIVMDVGAGSGILSIFCALAGAKKVYAVEASDVYLIAEDVVKENKLENIIEVLHCKVEDCNLPDNELVDVIVSEWMGFYLLHEGMLDSVLYARDKFLKPDGYLYPENATIYMAPCSVPSLFDFWNNVHGVKMKTFGTLLRKDKSNRPEVLHVESSQLLTEKIVLCWINLKDIKLEELNFFEMKQVTGAIKNGVYQGVCIWFECQFPYLDDNSENPSYILSTSPFEPRTHWKQTVIVLPEEQVIEKGQPLAWKLSMKRSEEFNRRYILELSLLDPSIESHPTPCNCHMTKCIVIRTYLEKFPNGEVDNKIKNVDSDDSSENSES